jgi:hypothetical protein
MHEGHWTLGLDMIRTIHDDLLTNTMKAYANGSIWHQYLKMGFESCCLIYTIIFTLKYYQNFMVH